MRPALRLALLSACLLALPAAAEARTTWLCKPGAANNPCEASLTATVVSPDGSLGATERTPRARRPPIDCFYVYPTVSEQPTVNANRQRDVHVRAVARAQASRFSSVCRVWVPVYRQLTLGAISNPGSVDAEARRKPYADVRAAWREYLRKHNRGRGVVLLSHSQGTFVLREMIANEIDRRPAVRRRLVSALLFGGNVEVRSGSTNGGDFRNIRACSSPSQIGCVVAWSMYNETPPENTIFGRGGDGVEVLCTDPASLGVSGGTLDGHMLGGTYPGLIGQGIAFMAGELPSVPTPWISFPGHYSGRCVREAGTHTLRIGELGGARRFTPSPDAGWGLHLADMNLAMGNLTELVRRQAAEFRRRRD
jgi:Protein of unknown function (DUF3089)